jgi:hypothetical protein
MQICIYRKSIDYIMMHFVGIKKSIDSYLLHICIYKESIQTAFPACRIRTSSEEERINLSSGNQ